MTADILYPDFFGATGLTANGSAAVVGDRLRLTPVAQFQRGSAWSDARQRVDTGFSTTFTFEITPFGFGGDGFAFLLQNAAEGSLALGSDGAYLGYGLGNHPGIANSLAIEFDTIHNAWDPSENHIGVQSCATAENTTDHTLCNLGLAASPANIRFGIHVADIRYVPGSLQIALDGLPVLSAGVDLEALLNLDGGTAFVGFTGGTGSLIASHDILAWQFQEGPAVPEPSSLLLVCSAFGLGWYAMRKRGRSIG